MSLTRLAVATANRGKLREWSRLLHQGELPPLEILSLQDFPSLTQADETGATLAENARIKALHLAAVAGCVTLADDTGLEVDALDGAPGVRSARFAGPDASDADNIDHLLALLADVPPPRKARFRCTVALVDPEQQREHLVTGLCQGEILGQRRGDRGFGYDPVFYLPRLDRTFAELSAEAKSAVGHRGEAAARATAVLSRWL